MYVVQTGLSSQPLEAQHIMPASSSQVSIVLEPHATIEASHASAHARQVASALQKSAEVAQSEALDVVAKALA